jgi:hypothetical protein
MTKTRRPWSWPMQLIAILGVGLAACGDTKEKEAGDLHDIEKEAGDLHDIEEMNSGLGTLAWTDIRSDMGTPAVTGSTAGAGNEFVLPPCSDGSGPDQSYRWTVPSTATYNFNTRGSSINTVLHLYNFNTSSLLGCNDDISPPYS